MCTHEATMRAAVQQLGGVVWLGRWVGVSYCVCVCCGSVCVSTTMSAWSKVHRTFTLSRVHTSMWNSGSLQPGVRQLIVNLFFLPVDCTLYRYVLIPSVPKVESSHLVVAHHPTAQTHASTPAHTHRSVSPVICQQRHQSCAPAFRSWTLHSDVAVCMPCAAISVSHSNV